LRFGGRILNRVTVSAFRWCCVLCAEIAATAEATARILERKNSSARHNISLLDAAGDQVTVLSHRPAAEVTAARW
jgi:hypothetical protein